MRRWGEGGGESQQEGSDGEDTGGAIDERLPSDSSRSSTVNPRIPRAPSPFECGIQQGSVCYHGRSEGEWSLFASGEVGTA